MLRTSTRANGMNELINTKELYEARLQAWQNVTVKSKKDGTEFKAIGKAIKGAEYEKYIYAPSGAYQLRVTFKTLAQGYCSDTIYCYKSLDKGESDLIRHKENIIENVGYKPIYKFDIDDIREAIRNRIENLGEMIDSIQTQIEHYDISYDRISEEVDKLQKLLKAETKDKQEIELYYQLMHAINEVLY